MKSKKIILSLSFLSTIMTLIFTSINFYNQTSNTFGENVYDPVDAGYKRIFLDKGELGWWDVDATPYLFWENTSDNSNNSWPGLAMNKLEVTGMYYYDAPISSNKIVFTRVASGCNNFFTANLCNKTDDLWSFEGIENRFFKFDSEAGGVAAGTFNHYFNESFFVDKLMGSLDFYLTCEPSFDGYWDVPYLRMALYDPMPSQDKTDFFNLGQRNDYDHTEYVDSYDGLTVNTLTYPREKWFKMETMYITYRDANYPRSYSSI